MANLISINGFGSFVSSAAGQGGQFSKGASDQMPNCQSNEKFVDYFLMIRIIKFEHVCAFVASGQGVAQGQTRN